MSLSITNWHNIITCTSLNCPMIVFKDWTEVAMCKYARLACMLDIIMCSGVNTVLITTIILRAIMGELKRVCN